MTETVELQTTKDVEDASATHTRLPNFSKGAITIEFQSLTYTIQTKSGQQRKLLDNVSAHLEAGKITAIMGSSGAGKTTLLNLLSGRIREGKGKNIDGSILINGESVKNKEVRKISAYVMQDDIMLPYLTPREQVTFSANLTLVGFSQEEKEQRVSHTLQTLGLVKCAETPVGEAGVTRGISGGERRRVSIATELVTDPSVVFLDEPTSGLDSETALSVIEFLHKLATEEGKTVIFTIHQPSSQIYSLFDNLILLTEGQVVYFGPAAEAPGHFNSIGAPVPEHSNPADHFLKLLHVKHLDKGEANNEDDSDPAKTVEEGKDNKKFTTTYFVSNRNKYPALSGLPPPIDRRPKKRSERVRSMTKLYYLSYRAIINKVRNKEAFFGKFMQYVFISIFAGLLFLQLGTDEYGVQNRVGFLFSLAMLFSFMPANGVILLFPQERSVFLREYAKGLYPSWIYYLSKNVVEIPVQIFYTTPAMTIAYWMAGLRSTAGAYFLAVLVYNTIAAVGASIGMIVGAAIKDIGKAMELGPSVIIPQMLVAGLFFSTEKMRVYLVWFEKISYLRWAFESAMINEFSGASIDCSRTAPNCTGDDVLDYYGFSHKFVETYFILFSMLVIYRIFGFIALHFTAINSASE
eukprot:TRINITY_DN2377_c0_g1_i1.p1 TRINITY_DN2377_c0_g1~~TRINITY_DN2377_c0_g1_i1.p1  ORF type:complete len:634 (-),score=143.83 TRINITY_DN2377_c0_g1_i1:85-1986(-)